MYDQTITRLRGVPTTDRYQNTTIDWSDPGRLDIVGLMVQPTSTTEQQDAPNRVPVIDGLWVCTRPGAAIPDLTPADRVEYDGDVYEITGEPRVWPDPVNGRADHMELTAQRVQG